jgi:hypothetical protein
MNEKLSDSEIQEIQLHLEDFLEDRRQLEKTAYKLACCLPVGPARVTAFEYYDTIRRIGSIQVPVN